MGISLKAMVEALDRTRLGRVRTNEGEPRLAVEEMDRPPRGSSRGSTWATSSPIEPLAQSWATGLPSVISAFSPTQARVRSKRGNAHLVGSLVRWSREIDVGEDGARWGDVDRAICKAGTEWSAA